MKKPFILPLFVLSLAGCVTRGDLNLAYRDIDEMKTRLATAEKNITTVSRDAKEIAEKSSRDALKDLETLRKGTADMQANLDAMRIELQLMAGKVEDQGLAAKKPYEDISLLKEDTAKAMSAMETRLKKLEAGLEENNARLAALSKSIAAPQTPENAYKIAYDTFRNGETAKARDMFSAFAEQYPEHKLMPNARYWIGETYYIEKNYEQAIIEFQKVIKDYPGKEKAPAAMLKQALAFRELKDPKSVRFVLQEIIDKYPQSEEYKAASDLLNKLK